MNSPAFDDRDMMPVRYTCDGDDISPPLSWDRAADDVRSYALVMEDPDAPGGTFTHWIVYGIPANRGSLPENLSLDVDYARAGMNDFEGDGYRGPCPPAGEGAHQYRFILYALDADVTLQRGSSRSELLDAMDSHVVDQATLAASYARQ
ncbi:MAG: YbhB/YbcL family Raf kinase inhibitor-like protein [Chloroflexota bacterium]